MFSVIVPEIFFSSISNVNTNHYQRESRSHYRPVLQQTGVTNNIKAGFAPFTVPVSHESVTIHNKCALIVKQLKVIEPPLFIFFYTCAFSAVTYRVPGRKKNGLYTVVFFYAYQPMVSKLEQFIVIIY